MTDPFRDALNASEAERGPFRTGEPTPERRLERAREESFARVQELTAEAVRLDRARERRTSRVLLSLLALSVVALLTVFVMAGLGVHTAAAWFCPALAAVVSFGLLSWKSRVLADAWSRDERG
ncbi:MAG: hypothetical protein H6719_22195 [Sandaracinaceae bacterium]|nr:hypothetical protein [Sandaracinaceae bacterium]